VAKTDKQSNPRRPLPEAASVRVDPRRTIDDVFQRLVHVLGKKPEDARLEIRDRLLGGAPLIALQVAGGVTDSNGITTPPEGVTLPLNSQSWERMLLLRIREGKLVIEPGGNMIYPWDACSFVVINWSLVEELWPNPNRARSDPSAPASRPEDPHAPGPAKVTQQEWWDAYLTPERNAKLATEYKNITEASNGIASLMAEDSTIDGGAYKPRYIEKLLREMRIFPPVRRRERTLTYRVRS
jgi:hypothetical protein